MMSQNRPLQRKVDRYDGQVIWIDGEACYELGNYLGGGAAGVVYEGTDLRTDPTLSSVAIKILNPVGFKLMPSGPLQRCLVAVKGVSISVETRGSPLREDNVWWLVHPNSKQVIAAYEDPKYGTLREVPLPKCIEIWGWDGMGAGNYDDTCGNDEVLEKLGSLSQPVIVDGIHVHIPRVSPKYVKWLRSRRSIYREISNMKKLGSHPNVIKLHEVLELIQDSKSTLFLVLELVTGGELFDRIKVGCGTTEDVARRYFRQLLSGVGCCHARGVCHRDLKPENLLLSDGSESAVLKIADFGLSAAFAIAAGGGDVDHHEMIGGGGGGKGGISIGGSGQNVRRLKSVVGSPHYVAPEVTHESLQGYDGTKADAWSAGIILYAMLVGNLPFGKELTQCPRFQRFRRWLASAMTAASASSSSTSSSASSSSPEGGGGEREANSISFSVGDCTPWLFSQNISAGARSLIIGLLHPDPFYRLSIDTASRHPWVTGSSSASSSGIGGDLEPTTKLIQTLSHLNLNIQTYGRGGGMMHGLTVRSPPPLPRLEEGEGGEAGSPTRTWN